MESAFTPVASADAYIYLNSILYRHDKNNVNMKWVNDLSKYWYSIKRKSYIAELYPPVVIKTSVGAAVDANSGTVSATKPMEPPPTNKNFHRIIPKESGPNQLFWCIYIAHYGYKQYLEAVHYGATNIEMREKSAISEFLSKTPKRMKTTNYKLSVSATQELAGKFMVKPRDSIDMCIAFSVYYNITIYLVYSNRYLAFYPQETEGDLNGDHKLVIIYVEPSATKKGSEYTFYDDTDENKRVVISSIKNTHYEMCHYEKGLRGMSVYKVGELHAIADKLGVDKTGTKQELYNSLLVACSS